eukprot:3948167-Amphidinium_carterae.1
MQLAIVSACSLLCTLLEVGDPFYIYQLYIAMGTSLGLMAGGCGMVGGVLYRVSFLHRSQALVDEKLAAELAKQQKRLELLVMCGCQSFDIVRCKKRRNARRLVRKCVSYSTCPTGRKRRNGRTLVAGREVVQEQ